MKENKPVSIVQPKSQSLAPSNVSIKLTRLKNRVSKASTNMEGWKEGRKDWREVTGIGVDLFAEWAVAYIPHIIRDKPWGSCEQRPKTLPHSSTMTTRIKGTSLQLQNVEEYNILICTRLCFESTERRATEALKMKQTSNEKAWEDVPYCYWLEGRA